MSQAYAWFHAVADRLTDALLLVAPDGDVLTCNAAAMHTVPSACQGNLITRAEDPATFRRFLSLASRSASPLPGKIQLDGVRWRCDAGTATFADDRAIVLQLRSMSETVRRFVTLNEQIDRLQAEIRRRETLEAQHRELLEREQQARQDAEDAGRVKDELLASVSHELRTPLHAISGWLAVLRENLEDRQRLERGLNVIERNVAAETQLTEDLVDASLLMTGRMRLSVGPVDMERIVRDAVENVRPAVDAKQQQIEVIADVGGCIVNGDRDRLLQVVWNLLSNATKHTPRAGKIQVVLRCVDSHAELTVTDTGEGMAQDQLPFVFDRFFRGEKGTTRARGGLGLGLAIVRHLIELHGGLVAAHSDGPGKGSTFTVTLPLPAFRRQPAAPPDQAGVDDSGHKMPLQGLRVFLVEDHADSRELLEQILNARGAAVETFDHAAPVYAAFRQRRPDILISDIEMPEEDGFTLMRKLREIEREDGHTPVPAIAVTAHGVSGARLHALRAGYQAFFTKPVTPDELVASIANLCRSLSAP